VREICVATKSSKKMRYRIWDDLGEYAETKNKFQQLDFFSMDIQQLKNGGADQVLSKKTAEGLGSLDCLCELYLQ
jgi:hypothetical protein